MQLVETHQVKRGSDLYKELDDFCLKSKNIYNYILYLWRQEFILNKSYTSQAKMYALLKNHECYKYLPQNVFGQVFLQFYKNINGYFKSLKEFKKNPQKFKSRPKLPKYKDKKSGRFICVFNKCVIPIRKTKVDGLIRLTGLSVKIKTKLHYKQIKQVRVVPSKGDYINLEIVYELDETKIEVNDKIAGIDVGLNNLAAVSFNFEKPIIYNGRPLKSINQYYNKKCADKQSKLRNNKKTSNSIRSLTRKRRNKIQDYLHKVSRHLVNQLASKDVSILVIGKNDNWKQDINLGKKNNQNFVMVPHARFIEMLSYKCKMYGIKVILVDEAYTSKCSFLDREELCKHDEYMGKRIKRGLFVTKNGLKINADINGSLNIIKKAIPTAFQNVNGIEALVVEPSVITVK